MGEKGAHVGHAWQRGARMWGVHGNGGARTAMGARAARGGARGNGGHARGACMAPRRRVYMSCPPHLKLPSLLLLAPCNLQSALLGTLEAKGLSPSYLGGEVFANFF
jgi:hypothetical protein